MIDRVNRGHHPAVIVERFTRVRIHIETREIAAGNIHANAMPFLEDIGSGVKFDREGIDCSWLHHLLELERVAKPSADDAVLQI